MPGQSADENEQKHEADDNGPDGTAHPAPAVHTTAAVAAAGHTPGELTHADHPHRTGPAPGRQPTDIAVHRGETAGRGPALAVFAALLAAPAGGGHRRSLP